MHSFQKTARGQFSCPRAALSQRTGLTVILNRKHSLQKLLVKFRIKIIEVPAVQFFFRALQRFSESLKMNDLPAS